MKSTFTFLFTIFLICALNQAYAQDINEGIISGAYPLEGKQGPCLSDAQRAEVKAEIMQSIAQLKSYNKLVFDGTHRPAAHPMFAWPLRKASHITYNDIYSARFYVDQNMAYPNQILDFNCGTKTYDNIAGCNHGGSDFVTWPFP